MGLLTEPGTPVFLSCRWAGWSWSWLVPLRYSESLRLKETSLSGAGYCLGVLRLAGFSASWSACLQSAPPLSAHSCDSKCRFIKVDHNQTR